MTDDLTPYVKEDSQGRQTFGLTDLTQPEAYIEARYPADIIQ